jgi:rhodanese-related sulfurtransferase/ketosteroid isomerase-like protein
VTTQRGVGTSATMTLERLQQFSDAWSRGDVDALMSFMTDDCVYFSSVGPEPGTSYHGREQVRRGFTEMLAFDRDRERQSGPALIVGNVGVAEWSFAEARDGSQSLVIRGCDIFEFRGEKIRKKDAFRKVLLPGPNQGAESQETAAATSPMSHSAVTAVPAADVGEARQHFEFKLACETDCADVWNAIDSGHPEFLVVDCRPTVNYNKAHIPGAISLPWSEITAERIQNLPPGLLVTYCWGPSCNASTKGAHRLAALGRQVKEMIGGLEYWIREGHPTEGKRPIERGHEKPVDWGLVV